ncbi:60S acidic ribosomal protein P1 [Cichlidogyrus casuarinus]|uniref:Replication protein A subunit n=1 Tax=Cichlidogyrus casuarinus TaxID=1844966 RepID=A0ABD2PXC8_9PLAT
MLAGHLSESLTNGTLSDGTLIKITEHSFNQANTRDGVKNVLIVMNFEVVENDNRQPLTTVINNDMSIPSTPPRSMNMSSMPGTPGGPTKVVPITSLNPYQSRWSVQGRVSQKAPLRTWNKNGREGKLFSFVLNDATGEIRVTAFNAEVDRFIDMIEINRVYQLSKGTVKAARKEFNNTNNEYEITLNSDSVLVPCDQSEAEALPKIHFNFLPLNKLDSKNSGDFVDVIGVAHAWTEASSIVGKATQRSITKRDISLVDNTNTLVRLTIWGAEADKFEPHDKPVLIIKGAKVGDFGGRNLSLTTNSTFLMNSSDVPECSKMRMWYESVGSSQTFSMFTADNIGGSGGDNAYSQQLTPISEITQAYTTQPSGTNYFNVKVDVVFMKRDNYLYKACNQNNCNKKLIQLSDNEYRCEKCNRNSSEFNYRFILQVKISDFSGDCWVTLFQDTAELVLGKTAAEIGRLEDENDRDSIDKVFAKVIFSSWQFRLRSALEKYNDESRVKLTIQRAAHVDYPQYMRQLKTMIENFPK